MLFFLCLVVCDHRVGAFLPRMTSTDTGRAECRWAETTVLCAEHTREVGTLNSRMNESEGMHRRGGVTHAIMHSRSRMTVDPRIPTTPGRSTSGFTDEEDISCTKLEAP